jgi:hypothetical protein
MTENKKMEEKGVDLRSSYDQRTVSVTHDGHKVLKIEDYGRGMQIGLCAVLPTKDLDTALAIAQAYTSAIQIAKDMENTKDV